jgi:hypothetical protein
VHCTVVVYTNVRENLVLAVYHPTHGPIDYIDTKAKCRHQKIFPVKHKVRTYKEYHSVCPSSELGLPPPPTRRLVCPLPPVSGGRGTLAGEKGVGRVPIPTRGVHCGTLYMYVLCAVKGLYAGVYLSEATSPHVTPWREKPESRLEGQQLTKLGRNTNMTEYFSSR